MNMQLIWDDYQFYIKVIIVIFIISELIWIDLFYYEVNIDYWT